MFVCKTHRAEKRNRLELQNSEERASVVNKPIKLNRVIILPKQVWDSLYDTKKTRSLALLTPMTQYNVYLLCKTWVMYNCIKVIHMPTQILDFKWIQNLWSLGLRVKVAIRGPTNKTDLINWLWNGISLVHNPENLIHSMTRCHEFKYTYFLTIMVLALYINEIGLNFGLAPIPYFANTWKYLSALREYKMFHYTQT